MSTYGGTRIELYPVRYMTVHLKVQRDKVHKTKLQNHYLY